MIGRGAWIFPVEPAVKLIGDTIEYSMTTLPRTNPVSVCGYHIRESGATPAQEIAYAILIANAYIDNVRERATTLTTSWAGFPSTSMSSVTCGSRWPNSGPPGSSGRET